MMVTYERCRDDASNSDDHENDGSNNTILKIAKKYQSKIQSIFSL